MAKGATLLASSHPHGWGHQYCTFLGRLEGPIYMSESVELLPFWCYLHEFPSLLLKVLYVCLPHENVSPWLFIDVSIVSRIECAHRGHFINTCRMNVFCHCVCWYIAINLWSLCVKHTLDNSQDVSHWGKRKGWVRSLIVVKLGPSAAWFEILDWLSKVGQQGFCYQNQD